MSTPAPSAPAPVSGRRSARIAGGVLFVVAALIGAEAWTFQVAFVTDAIGPKALPLLAATILAVGGLGLLLRPDVDVEWPERGPGARIVGALAAFLVYAGVLPLLGFFLSTTTVVATLAALYGGPPRRAVLASAGLAGALWLLFVQLLSLPLPIGSLWMR